MLLLCLFPLFLRLRVVVVFMFAFPFEELALLNLWFKTPASALAAKAKLRFVAPLIWGWLRGVVMGS
jgi:hypothetical protein